MNSSTQITAQVPSGSGTVDVTVANGAAQSATSAATKFSFGAPTITALTPNNGIAAGNTTVVITGTGFTGVTGVTFGDTDALTYTVNSPTQITTRPPAGVLGTTVTVQVHTHGGDSDPGSESDITEPWDYHYGVPTLTNINHGSGLSGDPLTLTGSNFTDDARVFFGHAEVTTIDYSEIPSVLTVDVPVHHAGDLNTVDVTVVTGAGPSATTLLTTKFTYGAPTVTAVNPVSGSVGTSVVITGTGFTGVRSVKFIVGGVTKTASIV